MEIPGKMATGRHKDESVSVQMDRAQVPLDQVQLDDVRARLQECEFGRKHVHAHQAAVRNDLGLPSDCQCRRKETMAHLRYDGVNVLGDDRAVLSARLLLDALVHGLLDSHVSHGIREN